MFHDEKKMEIRQNFSNKNAWVTLKIYMCTYKVYININYIHNFMHLKLIHTHINYILIIYVIRIAKTKKYFESMVRGNPQAQKVLWLGSASCKCCTILQNRRKCYCVKGFKRLQDLTTYSLTGNRSSILG